MAGEWQSYIEQLLNSEKGHGYVEQGLICTHDGTILAASEGFSPSQSELLNLYACLSDYDAYVKTHSHYLTLAGTRYVVSELPRNIIAFRGDEGDVAAELTDKLIVIGYMSDEGKYEYCTAAVELLADYFRQNGY